MKLPFVITIIAIIIICVLWYYNWDNIALFWKRRSWRERFAIFSILIFVVGISFLQTQYLSSSPVAGLKNTHITAEQRREFIRDLDKWFLRQGYEVIIEIRGDNADNIDAQCRLFSRVTVQRFEDQGVLSKELKRLGFKRIHFYDYQYQWIGSIFAN